MQGQRRPRWSHYGDNRLMDILFLLVPLSIVLALCIIVALWYAVNSGQFEDMEREGERIFDSD